MNGKIVENLNDLKNIIPEELKSKSSTIISYFLEKFSNNMWSKVENNKKRDLLWKCEKDIIDSLENKNLRDSLSYDILGELIDNTPKDIINSSFKEAFEYLKKENIQLEGEYNDYFRYLYANCNSQEIKSEFSNFAITQMIDRHKRIKSKRE